MKHERLPPAWRGRQFSLVVATILAVTAPAGSAEQPAASASSVSEDSLRNTRWNIASHLYLLNYGHYDRPASEASTAYAAELGFNADF
jgi:hypothetical protein